MVKLVFLSDIRYNQTWRDGGNIQSQNMHVILFYRERRWDMDNEIVYSSKATDQKAQYDASAKRLLGQKIILAHILIRVVEEFKGMDADTVASLIEGEPYISQIPVEPGLTNKETVDARTGERIVGLNTESSEIDEVKIMCNLSEGVEEMGYAKGEAAGKVIGRSEGKLEGRSEERADIILKMHKKGYSLEQIMDVTEMSETEIKAIIG